MNIVTLTEKFGSLLAKDAHHGFSGSTMYPSTMSRAVLSWFDLKKHISIVNHQSLLELPLELGVVGHLQHALLLQLPVQLTQLAHVFSQLHLWHQL